MAVLQAAPEEESRAEQLALLLQSLGGYPVLMSDRCAGGGSLQPLKAKRDIGMSDSCKSIKIEVPILYPVKLCPLR